MGSELSVTDTRNALIQRLFATHGSAIQAFFRRRMRAKLDAPDLTQEVYLRMLRVSDAEVIRNPEGYLYSVANNLVKERSLLERRQHEAIVSSEAELAQLLTAFPSAEDQIDQAARVTRLREVLKELSPKCRAAVLMQYRHEMSYQEIAEKLGISTNMVKKYLAQAIALCRKRMERWR
jgi:RNA polymerase sigma factor (sigma-70 family)